MKRYIEPTIEIFDLKARGLMENIGVHGSTGVDQDPSHNGSGSGSFGAYGIHSLCMGQVNQSQNQ